MTALIQIHDMCPRKAIPGTAGETKARQAHRQTRSIRISQLPARSVVARDHALHVLAALRRDPKLSLSKAAKQEGISVRTVRRYVGSAVRQDRPGGRIQVTKSDKFVRYLQIPVLDASGNQILKRVVGSKEASEWGQFQRDVNRLLAAHTNEEHKAAIDAMAKWHGKSIGGVKLVTAEVTLTAWARDGRLPYGLYRQFNGGAS